jgi:DNA-binding transcriptional ArsR family regulator
MGMNTRNSKGHLTEQLRAVADPTRRRILRMLSLKGECSLGETTGLCARDLENKIRRPPPCATPRTMDVVPSRRKRGEADDQAISGRTLINSSEPAPLQSFPCG